MKNPKRKRNALWVHYSYDLRNGSRAVLSRFLLAIILFILGCVVCQLNLPVRLRFLGITDKVGFLDAWFFLFQGNVGFLPVTWLTIQLYIPFVVLLYPVRDLGGSGAQVLIRSRRRECWWTSKLLWAYTMVFLYYLLLAAVVAVFTAATGGKSVNRMAMLALGVQSDLNSELLLAMFLGPLLSSLAFVSLELAISTVVSPVISFMSGLLLQLLTVYFITPFLFGNVSMLDRIDVLGFCTVNFYQTAGIAVVVGLVSWLVGKRVITKKDILGNDEDRY